MINKYVIVLLFFALKSFAQLKLKQHNFVSVGDTIVEYFERFPKNTVDIGTPGKDKTWDFSDLNSTVVGKETIVFVDPLDTPFSNDYPDSNIALYSNQGYECWVFMKNTKKELTNLGFGLFSQNKKQTGNYGGITIKYPLKYLDEFSSEIKKEHILIKTKKGKDSIKVKTIFNHKYEIDAWGDVILPKGTFLALRMKYILKTTNLTYQKKEGKWNLKGIPKEDVTVSYKWWTDDENAKYPVVQIVMDNTQEKPLVIKYLESKPFVEIIEENKKDETLIVYPNPVKENLFVQIPKIEEVYIIIYSFNGRVIKSVKSNYKKTDISVSNLPQGIYFLVVKNKEGQVIGKNKIVKID